MANFTGSSISGIDIFDWQEWGFDEFVSSSQTQFVYETSTGNTVRIFGSEFSYDKEGNPVGGTVHTVGVFDSNGDQIASLVAGDADLADLAANDFNTLWEVMLDSDDFIFTGHEDDSIAGHDGNDVIWGGGGFDNIFGGRGDDSLNGEKGDDNVFGDEGDDTIIFDPQQGNDRIYGGDGEDTVVTNGLKVDFSDIVEVSRIAARDGGGGRRTEKFPDHKESSRDPSSASVDNSFTTKPGTTANEDFNVLLEVGSSTGSGIPGEPGRNEATLTGVEMLEVRTGDMADELHVHALTGTALENGRVIYDGGAGSDDLYATNATTAITYEWRFAEDEGHPGGGVVRFGNSDQDEFHLVDDADEGISVNLDLNFVGTLEIDAGVFGGGFGSDLTVFNVEHLNFDFGDGDDRLIIHEDLSSAYDGLVDIQFGDGENLLDVFGGHTGRIEAIGGDDHNAFFSGDGDDLLIGGDDHDDIFGGDGDDEIHAGASFDSIGGGAGNDRIWGGDDGDRFIFEQGSGTDTIMDFVAGDAGNDVLDFLALAITQDDLQIVQVAADTHVTTEFGDTVILQNVLSTDLNSGDFLL